MYCDIIFAEENEAEFLKMAEEIGIEALMIIYQYKDNKTIEAVNKKLANLQKNTPVKLKPAFIAEGNTIYKIKDKKEISIARANENARDTVARLSPAIVYDLELAKEKDYAKSKNSGLDKATCQFAKANNVIAAVTFSSILESENLAKII